MTSVVNTSQGPTGLGVHTTAGDWVEDFGNARLVDGRARVELDPIFIEAVTIDSDNPLLVFLQPNDPTCKGLAAMPGRTGFDVVELLDGTSADGFTYRVVAKRKGFEQRRLELVEVPHETQ
jgi:hypothetical protein